MPSHSTLQFITCNMRISSVLALALFGYQANATPALKQTSIQPPGTCDLQVWSHPFDPTYPCIAKCNQNIPGDPFHYVMYGCGRAGCKYETTIPGGGVQCGNSCLSPITCNGSTPVVACDAIDLTQSCAASGPNTCTAIQSDTDYQGFDIGSTQQPAADKCCQDCLANPACKVFVWYQGTCYLKSSGQGGKLTLPGRQASFVAWPLPPSSACPTLQLDFDYFGNDISSVARPSASHCCNDCKTTTGCRLFVWSNGVCYLKNAQGASNYKPGVQAGIFGTAPFPTCGATESDTDYPGQDVSNRAASSLGECCGACMNNVQCNAFAFAQSTNMCYLKSGRASAIVKPGIQSARVNKCSGIDVGVDYVGNDLSAVASASIDDCCAFCRNYNGCKAFSYANGNCYLKSGKTATTTNANVASATILG
ncbi:Aste57867_9447 [Aphanomyces stellatus]|uniref:Aste57867_9447 protein n=1 Tax=Aphanomyces stellatus TaxID=120398 RepID=A0A485KMT6_9STRA|nr:hypothetical protein As57867_009411 [Aphanomyces stellatus]VFT86327.1 Aste57867_9447 [Aphanomyces stellatus]